MGVRIQKPGDPGHPGGNRRIYVRVNDGGHRKTRVFNSSKAAESYAAQVEAWLKIGDAGKVFARAVPDPAPAPVVPTVAEAVPQWQETEGAAGKLSTRGTYHSALATHVLPTFGPRRFDAITAADVVTWWGALRGKGYSVSHLNVIRTAWHHVCAWAVTMGWASRNPVAALAGKVGPRALGQGDADWLTQAELPRLLAAARGHVPAQYAAILTTATGGIRWCELCALQVGDVDLPRARLYIRRRLYKGRLDTPKSGRFRVVDLPAVTVAVLEDWLAVVALDATVRGAAPLWLFPAPDGTNLRYGAFRRALALAAKTAGIGRPVKPHVLRHSYASLALQQGVPLLTVSRQLGHASISTTADTYGHLAENAGRQAAAAIESLLADEPSRNPGATSTAHPA